MIVEQPLEQVGQGDDSKPDPGSEGQDEEPVHLSEPPDAAGDVKAEERTQRRTSRAHRGDESFVHSEDERDRASGYTGDDVGGTHQEATEEGPGNLADHGGECRCGPAPPVYRALRTIRGGSMRVVLQRVSRSAVQVDGETTGKIGVGLLALVGVAAGDAAADARIAAIKTIGMRIFPDEGGKMNRSVADTGGSVLVVSQFTLLADVRKGRRPAFTSAARPEEAIPILEAFTDAIEAEGVPVAHGRFGAHMEVDLLNDGPVTIVFDVQDGRIR